MFFCRNKLFTYTLAMMLGVLLTENVIRYIDCSILIGIAVVLSICAFMVRKKSFIVIIVIVFLLASAFYATMRHNRENDFKSIGDFACFNGEIVSRKYNSGFNELKVKEKNIGHYILVKYYDEGAEVYVGQNIEVTGTITPVKEDPIESFYDDIIGEIDTKSNCVKLFEPSDFIYKIRKQICIWLDEYKEYADFYRAILIGDKGNLDADVKNNFYMSGLGHILAISGLHVTLIISFMLFVLNKMFKNRWVKLGAMIAVLGFFLLLTGLSFSIFRAIIMALILYGKFLVQRDYCSVAALSGATIIFFVINPFIVFDVGFLLSAGAVLGISLFNKPIRTGLMKFVGSRMIVNSISMTLSAQIFTTPLIVLNSNKMNIAGLLSNTIILPVFSVVMVLLIMSMILTPFALSGLISNALLAVTNVLFNLINFVNGSGVNEIGVRGVGVILVALMPLAFTCLLIFKDKKRCVAIVVVVGLIMGIGNANSQLEITFLNVGQGDSILIKLPTNKYMLIDTGEEHAKVYRLLLERGIVELEAMIITHNHTDHVGGANDVCENLKVKRVYQGDLFGGTILRLGEVSMRVLSPNEVSEDENDNSIVIHLRYGKFDCLLTGDITAEVERNLAIESGMELLKIAHHGSRYSSCDELLEKFSGKDAIISVGENKFGHPNDETLKALRKFDVWTYRTDLDGEIMVSCDGERYKIACQRSLVYCGGANIGDKRAEK